MSSPLELGRAATVKARLRGGRLKRVHIEANLSQRDYDAALRRAVLRGYGVSGYCSYQHARAWGQAVMGEIPHDVWYTERNGDCITLICPQGVSPNVLPDEAMGYKVFEWIPPEGEFTQRSGNLRAVKW